MSSNQVKFINPNAAHFHENIMFASSLCLPELQPGGYEGRTVILAGSGPSLKTPEVLDELRRLVDEEDAVMFANKFAVEYLDEQGFKIDISANIDPGQHIPKRIKRVPGCRYYIASSSDPVTFKHLLADPPMDVHVFHSACGLDIEVPMYQELFSNPDAMTGGYNIVNRAYAIAVYMGFEKFIFAGMDSGWRDDQNCYVTNDKFYQKKVYLHDNGLIDGKPWHSTPDMLASAVSLAKLAKKMDEMGEGHRIDFLGDVLPRALREKDYDYLNTIARMEKEQP